MGDKIVGIHQPNFLPWLGYFYKIANCDVFVLLDNVQYTKNSFINRNRIKTANGPLWLTVPVKVRGRFGQSIKDVEINNKIDWKKKHLRTLKMNYKKAEFFEEIYKSIKEIYLDKEWVSLCEFNVELLTLVIKMLGIRKKIIKSSELNVKGEGAQLLINIVKKIGGDVYLSGFGGAKYQEENLFEETGVKLRYYHFEYPIYPQLWNNFIPNLSIIDLLFNRDKESIKLKLI